MEPVTHVLTGACLARAGFNRKTAYATLAMAVAAEFPDIDTLWSLGGPVTGFTHHRGITHTFLGLPFEAALIVAAVYGFDRWRASRAKKPSTTPVRWGWLYACALIALLSHLLLDFTNNYGIRPFFPFEKHWYAASIVFIFDPAIFLLLLGALVVPAIFRMVNSEISSGQKQPFAPRGWSVAALVLVASLWVFREIEHNHAVTLAMSQSLESEAPATKAVDPDDADSLPAPMTPVVYLQPQRVLAGPDPLNVFRWFTVTDFGAVYQQAEVDTRNASYVPTQETIPKPDGSAVVRAAQATALGRAYMDWSPMPFVDADQPNEAGHTVVTFRDPRFLGDVTLLNMSGRAPLTGIVELDAQRRVIYESMDGREQK